MILKTFTLDVSRSGKNHYSEMVKPLIIGLGDARIKELHLQVHGEDKEGCIGEMLAKSKHLKKLRLRLCDVFFT